MNYLHLAHLTDFFPLPPFSAKEIFSNTNKKILSTAIHNLACLSCSLLTHLYITKKYHVLGGGAKTILYSNYLLSGAVAAVFAKGVVDIVKKTSKENRFFTKTALFVGQSTLVNALWLSYPQFLIHEYSHKLAAISLFKNARSIVTIYPFNSGKNSYISSRNLTAFGCLWGREGAKLVIDAAGFSGSLIFTITMLGLSHLLREEVEMSKFLKLAALSQIVNEVVYAVFSLVDERNKNNDFTKLWMIGRIHPAICISVLVALPVITAVYLEYRSAKNTNKNLCKTQEYQRELSFSVNK